MHYPPHGPYPPGGAHAPPPAHTPAPYPSPYGPPPQPSGWGGGTAVVIVLAILGIGVLLVGVLAVLGIYGTRKYIANAKTAEARVTVREIATDAVSAYESGASPPSLGYGGGGYGGAYGGGLGGAAPRRLCASASHPVPASLADVSGKKWMSLPGDWDEDRAKNAGFACLHFEMSQPQYYQYDYTRHGAGAMPGDGFTAQASGDLDGDGDASTFQLDGRIGPGGTVDLSPTILETNPEE